MSQHNSFTNFDKGKLLMVARVRLGLSLAQMAGKLNLDATSLSQLEKAMRKVDEFHVQRAEKFVRDLKNENLN